ncbi:rhodanese-like domain-containing protein, partial [Clostridium perfringens]|uniref:rhodanese-like domain-containing protein n=1 Tax=Clostridium perfringens TaxID=1502 RepID=UPI0032DAE835
NKEILVYCAVGLRGWIGERILKQHGFKAKNLSGGYKAYKTYGYKAKELSKENINSLEAAVDMMKDRKVREL